MEVLREVCKYLYSLSPTRFNELYESVEFKRFFSDDKDELSRHLEFVQSKYVDKNLISNDIITFLSKICERMNIPPESISFSVINNTE